MPIHGYQGNVISGTPPSVSPTSASGVWTLDDQLQNAANWPSQSNIARSLRFNSADSAYLNRTPSVAGDRQKFTWSGWIKRSKLGLDGPRMFVAGSGSDIFIGRFLTSDAFQIVFFNGTNYGFSTVQVFRDVSSWYHFVIAVDTTQATDTNRFKLYVNGSQVTNTTSLGALVPQNTNLPVNNTVAHSMGIGGGNYFDGYLADVYLIDGQALTPSSFGYTDSNGIWQPNSYTGSYGTNGFWLNFDDNSGTTATTLGKDSSGNGNNWTPNNFSVTAGAGNDSLVDSPTNYGTDTGVGGEVRGNYCTLNPLDAGSTQIITNGNLNVASNSSTVFTSTRASIGVSSGKWYWEALCVATTTTSEQVGIGTSAAPVFDNYFVATSNGYGYRSNGQKWTNNAGATYGDSWGVNDLIGVALDIDAGTVTFYKNGVSQGVAFSGLSGTLFPMVFIRDTSGLLSFNFGQRPFAYTAPAGFKALCSTNLPTPTIQKGGSYFAPVIYTGNGSSRSITGVGFQPSLVWIKARNAPYSHRLSDAVRGVGKELYSDDTSAEVINSPNGYVTSFDSDGFSLGTGLGVNLNAQPYIAWTWRANGAGSSNTSGSITSTVSANQTSGFSVVRWDGNGAGAAATIGHGLGSVPKMIINKGLDFTSAWSVYHVSAGNTVRLTLNLASAVDTNSGYWNNTTPTSTVFTVGNIINQATPYDYVAYCFAEVPGYSAFGSYTGNGSTDGPFVYTGFRPAYLLIKRSNDAADWYVYDAKRNTYNALNSILSPNLSNADATNSAYDIDFTANGFKLRLTATYANSNASTYIYAAFAENPFKIARAR